MCSQRELELEELRLVELELVLEAMRSPSLPLAGRSTLRTRSAFWTPSSTKMTRSLDGFSTGIMRNGVG